MTQDCREEFTHADPQRQTEKQTGPVLLKSRGQQPNYDSANDGSNRAYTSFAQRGSKAWLAYDGSRNARPESAIELKAIGTKSARITEAERRKP
jgi:hypothetical protein